MWEPIKKSVDAFAGTSMSLRCYETHPPMKIGKGRLVGGSASHPFTKNADVYVALQSGSTSGLSSDPWEAQTVVEVHYGITDMGAPTNVERFKKMVTWLCTQLQDGKTVHVGCIGGHGRTGTVLSAIVAEALGKTDAIQYVRKHYCKKAVESKEQVKFLIKHYGVTSVEPTKGAVTKWSTTGAWSSQRSLSEEPEWNDLPPARLDVVAAKSFTPMSSSRSLWKKKRN